MLCFQSNEAHQKFINLIQRAAQIGLPTRFLHVVARETCVNRGANDRYNLLLNQLIFKDSTLSSIKTLNEPGIGLTDSAALGIIYHEALHAYFDIKKDHPELAQLLQEGEEYYADSKLKTGVSASDPWRLSQEAVATYIQYRVANWLSTLSKLSFLASVEGVEGSELRRELQRTREHYNKAMNQRVFGYQMSGGFFGLGAQQVETTSPIPDKLRQFLDREILENRIADLFDQVIAFQPLVREIINKSNKKN